jgi:hypothetical protein
MKTRSRGRFEVGTSIPFFFRLVDFFFAIAMRNFDGIVFHHRAAATKFRRRFDLLTPALSSLKNDFP